MSKYNSLVPVRAKYAAIFKPGISKDHGTHADVMRELLAEWNPVGLSEDQIVFVLGPPSSQDKEYNYFAYHFENGFNGVGWNFVFKQGVVERVEKFGIQ